MKRLLIIGLILFCITSKTAAQQNWAAVPCFEIRGIDNIGRLLIDSAHNELILIPNYSYQICNTAYKGLFAFNGNAFHDLDFGIETHNPNPYIGAVILTDCAEYNNKAIFTGAFRSVGSNTLYSRSIAIWDGVVWDTFPQPFWSNSPTSTIFAGFSRLLKQDGKLWMLGGIDSTGNNFTYKLVVYNGSTFTSIPPIPVNTPGAITEAIFYKNKLVVAGNFYNSPNFDWFRLAQFDGITWSQVGNGIQGGLSAVQTVAVYNDTLYIGGAFPKGAGNAGNYLMKWDGTQLIDAGFSDTFCGYGAIWKLLNYRNRLYAFGGFGCVAGQKAFGVAYYENGKWTVPQDSIEGNGIFDAVVYKDAIYIGGSFKSVNGDTTIQKFAKLLCLDFDIASGCISGVKESSRKINFKIFPNPSKDKLNVEFEEISTIEKLIILNTLGQEMKTVFKPLSKTEVDISNLPRGIYFIKAESKQGLGVFKVVKE